MAGYCTSVWPYFHEPQASENTAQVCNIYILLCFSRNKKVDSYCACAVQRSCFYVHTNSFLEVQGCQKQVEEIQVICA